MRDSLATLQIRFLREIGGNGGYECSIMSKETTQPAIQLLKSAPEILGETPALVGMDGFVDTILHVVRKRHSATRYDRFNAMRDLAGRIDAAAGLSANFELVPQLVKLGGNGPIMAHALSSLGLKTTYIGALGKPLHPVFEEFAREAEIYSIAEPGYTDALEFDDGKLMLGKQGGIHSVSWELLLETIPEELLLKILQRSKLVALVNWTMLTQMTPLLKKLLSRAAPKLTGEKRLIFFDLADPAKRPEEDLLGLMALLPKFEKYFRVILGLNLMESRQVGSVLGMKDPGDQPDSVTAHASELRQRLGLHTVVVHPSKFAAAADDTGAVHVSGPFTEKPRISTGAGDHFNAGFCTGRVLGGALQESLLLGVATSGFYVRKAKSPSTKDLQRFLKTF